MTAEEYQALEMECARSAIHRFLGNGRWTATGILRRLLARDGFPINEWDGDQWMQNILDGLVNDSRIECRECYIDMPGNRFLAYYEYRLPPNADGSDHAHR